MNASKTPRGAKKSHKCKFGEQKCTFTHEVQSKAASGGNNVNSAKFPP